MNLQWKLLDTSTAERPRWWLFRTDERGFSVGFALVYRHWDFNTAEASWRVRSARAGGVFDDLEEAKAWAVATVVMEEAA